MNKYVYNVHVDVFIYHSISDNEAKMFVCHISVLESGTALSLKIWDLIRDSLLEDMRFQRKLGFEI